jgi:hypothetical protein
MKAFKKTVLAHLMLLLFLTGAVSLASAQIPDDIILGLKTGNAKMLGSYFNQNVELVILENDNVYSKAQAEQIVTSFFARYQPERFSVIHQGGKEGAQYVIGTLVTKQGSFRVYFLLKKNTGKDIIHQFRIEKTE